MESDRQIDTTPWEAFCRINESRRAIRDFDGKALAYADVCALLEQATLAPSSGNLQPYQFHWVRSTEMLRRLADACNAQRAARSASTLVVVVASRKIALESLKQQLANVRCSKLLPPESKRYHLEQLKKFCWFLRLAPLAVWWPFLFVGSLLRPELTLLPIGPSGIRQWAARNAVFAAQTLMLAAAASGVDTCPLEGFSASKVATILRLPRGSVIPVVIALGRRRADALVERQWRRPTPLVVVEH